MITVNAMGDSCPIPVIKTKKAMQSLTGPETIEVLVDNEIAVQNVTKMASSGGGKVTSEKLGEKEYKVTIAMGGAAAAVDDAEETACIPDARDNMVVVVSSDRMGSGNDELGKVLIKGFLYALSQMETHVDTILFYNGGAKLTTEGSDSIEDLKKMEAEGTEILTCGTCLKHYGLMEKLLVGKVTDMYTITERMMGADKIIRP